MVRGPVASIFASPHTKRDRISADDAELQKALKLSEEEARLSVLSEDELLQRALDASREEVESKAKRSVPDGDDVEEEETPTKKMKLPQQVFGQTKEADVNEELNFTQESFGDKEEIINRLNGSLDLIYCKGWIRREERVKLREWMLRELMWHRVSYTNVRSKQKIRTPRFTATFGKDDTGAPDSAYPVKPKAIPPILDQLRTQLEQKTGARFNAIIVNYYKDGSDSISYHADDESFLGPLPTIASLSLGSSRDFFLRRKLADDKTSTQQFYTKGSGPAASRLTEKMVLSDGDLLVMKGRSQSEWEHAIDPVRLFQMVLGVGASLKCSKSACVCTTTVWRVVFFDPLLQHLRPMTLKTTTASSSSLSLLFAISSYCLNLPSCLFAFGRLLPILNDMPCFSSPSGMSFSLLAMAS